jgi:DNA polymerase-3 subunit beta
VSTTTTAPATVAITASELKAAAQWVARTIPTRPVVPILAGMALRASDGLLSMSAFDFEAYTIAGVTAPSEFDGPVLVHGRTFADAVGRLTGRVTMTVDDTVVTLSAGRQVFRLRRLESDQYPDVPPAAPSAGTLDADDLADLLSRVSVAAARDTKGEFNLYAVHLSASGGVLKAVATNRYLAARMSRPWAGEDFTALVASSAITGALRGMSGPVEIGADDSHVTIASADRSSTLVQIAGQYPQVERVIDATKLAGTSARVSRADLTEAVAAARLTLDRAQPIWLDFTPGQVEVSGGGDSGDASAVLDADGDADTRIAVSGEYLSDLLGALPGPQVQIEPGTRPQLPFRARPADADGAVIDGVDFVLVPIRMAEGSR